MPKFDKLSKEDQKHLAESLLSQKESNDSISKDIDSEIVQLQAQISLFQSRLSQLDLKKAQLVRDNFLFDSIQDDI